MEVSVEPTFQNGSQTKHAVTCTDKLPLYSNDVESVQKHYVCKNPYFNRKYSMEHGNARRYRSALLQCGVITDFSLMTGLNIIANGVAKLTHRGSFLRNWNFLLLHMSVQTVYIV